MKQGFVWDKIAGVAELQNYLQGDTQSLVKTTVHCALSTP